MQLLFADQQPRKDEHNRMVFPVELRRASREVKPSRLHALVRSDFSETYAPNMEENHLEDQVLRPVKTVVPKETTSTISVQIVELISSTQLLAFLKVRSCIIVKKNAPDR